MPDNGENNSRLILQIVLWFLLFFKKVLGFSSFLNNLFFSKKRKILKTCLINFVIHFLFDSLWFLIDILPTLTNSKKTSEVAINFLSEKGFEEEITWEQLYNKVCKFSGYLKSIGLRKGDRAAAYVPNKIESIISFLACAKNGNIWSSYQVCGTNHDGTSEWCAISEVAGLPPSDAEEWYSLGEDSMVEGPFKWSNLKGWYDSGAVAPELRERCCENSFRLQYGGLKALLDCCTHTAGLARSKPSAQRLR